MVTPTEEEGLGSSASKLGSSLLNWGQKKIKDKMAESDTLQKSLNYSKKISMQDWLTTLNNCPYKYGYDETGMAIDTAHQSVILIQHINNLPITKTYPFHLIREWSYEIPGADVVQTFGPVHASTAMSVFARNWAAQKQAESRTGFKVRVKDIDYPEWFIKFESTRMVETDLKRWMEIFTQNVNETPQMDGPDLRKVTSGQESSPVASLKFCSSCGAKISKPGKFCPECGANISS